MTTKTTCFFCSKAYSTSNFSKHSSRCLIKNNFGISKAQILNLITQSLPSNDDKMLEDKCLSLKTQLDSLNQELFDLKIQNSNLTTCLYNIFNQANAVVEKIDISANITNYSLIIESLLIQDSTKNDYKALWEQYTKFCNDKNLTMLAEESANTFLGANYNINKKTTLMKKRNYLQYLLRVFSKNPLVKLNKIKKLGFIKPKLVLSKEKIICYLKEQKKLNFADYVCQRLQIDFGCRINSLANIKKCHLDYLINEEDSLIVLPDTKTGPRYIEVNSRQKRLLDWYLNKYNIGENDYLFKAGDSNVAMKRSLNLMRRINRRIKKSAIIPKTEHFACSSHMFRTTKATQEYKKAHEKAKARARVSIGHTSNSRAINNYIQVDKILNNNKKD